MFIQSASSIPSHHHFAILCSRPPDTHVMAEASVLASSSCLRDATLLIFPLWRFPSMTLWTLDVTSSFRGHPPVHLPSPSSFPAHNFVWHPLFSVFSSLFSDSPSFRHCETISFCSMMWANPASGTQLLSRGHKVTRTLKSWCLL